MTLSLKRAVAPFLIACLILGYASRASLAQEDRGPIRPAMLAGSWYPADPKELRSMVRGFLAEAQKKGGIEGDIFALVVPHAGLRFSGQVAAYAYSLLEGRAIKTVVLVGPSHRYPFQGFALWEKGGFDTPLGVVEVDEDLARVFRDKEPFMWHMPEPHNAEHSLEVQLPFIKTVLPDAKIVPIIMAEQSFPVARRLAYSLAKGLMDREGVVLVATTDLSHFHTSKKASVLDGEFMEHFARFDVDGLIESLEEGKCEACGAGPALVAMMTASLMGARRAKVIKYADSSAVTGDTQKVVGYMAGAIFNEKKGEGQHGKVGVDLGLTNREKALLKERALEIIRARLEGREPKPRGEVPEKLMEKRGAFVTLQKKGSLRGCIGYLEPTRPLIEAVENMAVCAAFQDPRFDPLKKKELKDIDIEISVLTPFEKIKDVSRIKVGVHGLYLKRGASSGLLLPQVAVEYGWNTEEFLDQTCRKAGMAKGCWQDERTEIYIFSADVF